MNDQKKTTSGFLMVLSIAALSIGLAATLKCFNAIAGFWEDEFYQIVFINEPYSSFIFSVARLDIHPPLHYFQLKLWGEFFSSDKGLLLNSVVWHLISCLAVFLVGRAWRGIRVGLLAACIYALIPQVVWSSVTLRQYSFIPAIAIGAWWLNLRVLCRASEVGNRWNWVGFAVLELALGFSHAIGFFFVFFIAFASAVQGYQTKRLAAPWKWWLIIQAAIGAVFLPIVLMASMRTGIPGNNPPIGNLLLFIGELVAGSSVVSVFWRWAGAALFALIVLLGLKNRETRTMTLCVLIAPLGVAFLVTLFLEPMLKVAVYSAVLMPFAALTLSDSLIHSQGNAGRWVAISVCVFLMGAIMPVTEQLLTGRTTNPWKEAVAQVKERAQAGDVVVIAKPFSYWAVMRYAVGPNWGVPSEVLPPLNERWLGLVRRLGPRLSEFLHIIPKTDHIIHDGIIYLINEDIKAVKHKAKNVFVIHALNYALPIKGADSYVDRGPIWKGDQNVELRLLEIQR